MIPWHLGGTQDCRCKLFRVIVASNDSVACLFDQITIERARFAHGGKSRPEVVVDLGQFTFKPIRTGAYRYADIGMVQILPSFFLRDRFMEVNQVQIEFWW